MWPKSKPKEYLGSQRASVVAHAKHMFRVQHEGDKVISNILLRCCALIYTNISHNDATIQLAIKLYSPN